MQRSHVMLICCLLLIIGLALSGCSPGSKGIAMFRGNPQHTGVYTSKGPTELHGVKWKFKTEGRVRSSPVYYDQAVYFGSEDKNLYAVNAETGKQIWKFPTKGAILSSPTIKNGEVYFLSGDNTFYALEASTGKMLWSFKIEGTNEARDDYDYWQSSAAIDERNVYFGGGNGIVYALDATTGKDVWQQHLHFQNPDTYKDFPVILHSSPIVASGVIYMGISGYIYDLRAEPGNVLALDAKTGKQIWTSELMQAVDSSPAIDNHAVYFGMRNGGIAALDIKTGKTLWRDHSVQYDLSSPAIYNGTIFSGSSDQHQLLALDASTGEAKWAFSTYAAVHASPVTDGKIVYCASANSYVEDTGYVYAVDAETGVEKWNLQIGGNIISSPTIHDGVLYVGNDDFNLYAIY